MTPEVTLGLIGAVSAALSAIFAYVVTRRTNNANADKTKADAEVTVGQAWQAVVAEQRGDIDRLRASDAEKGARIDALESDIQRLRDAEVTHARERVDGLERERSLDRQLVDARTKLAESEKRIDELTANSKQRIDALTAEVADLRRQLEARAQALEVERRIVAGNDPAAVAGAGSTA